MVKAKVPNAPKTWIVDGDSETHDDPLLDCLTQLAQIYNCQISRTGLKTGLPLVRNRITVELFPRAAQKAGLASRLLRRPLQGISNLELPCVLLLQDKRACLLLNIDQATGMAKLLLPETGMGEKTMAIEELDKLYNGYAIFVKPKYKLKSQESEQVKPQNRKNWFWGAIVSSWRIYRDVIVASFLINVFGLTSPFFILNVYDRVIPNSAFETLWVLSIGITVVYLFALLMRAIRGYFVDEAGKRANLRISASLFEKVLGLRMEVRPQSVGSFTKNLQQFESILELITSFSITALIDLPFVALGLFAVWYLGGDIVYIHLVAIALLLIYTAFIQVPLKKAVEKSFKASAQKNAILVEGIQGLETIKMLGAESQIQRAWEEAVSYIAKWSAKSRLLSSSVNNFANFIQNMVVVAIVIAGVYKVTNGDMSQGGLIALVILTRQAIGPMAQVVGLATRYHRAKEAYAVLNGIMELPEERPEGKTFLHRKRLHGAIELKSVNFAYPGQSTDVLKNINLKIAAGEKVGVIGSIGCGKTTLGKLILGLYQPTSGIVCVDDTDIRQIDPAELRHHIGYVSQDVTLFRGSIKDNITLGTDFIDDSAVLRAADLAGVSEFVNSFATGYDTEVGEQGKCLSGGQRQTIAMARAILLDPPILVLDEPTSSMDSRTEQRMKMKLTRMLRSKSMLLITHRASLLDLVSRIVVIDKGAIVADGPRKAVIEALKKGQLNV